MREDVGKARIRRHSEVGDDLVDVLDEFADAMRVNDSDGAVVSSAILLAARQQLPPPPPPPAALNATAGRSAELERLFSAFLKTVNVSTVG